MMQVFSLHTFDRTTLTVTDHIQVRTVKLCQTMHNKNTMVKLVNDNAKYTRVFITAFHKRKLTFSFFSETKKPRVFCDIFLSYFSGEP